jgi:transcription initiation factor TFIIIB Brf1 subunit/transcription initiation factor TFIIB
MKEVNVSVSMLCPICGFDQFKYEKDAGSSIQCNDCGHICEKDEFIADNSEQIDTGVEEVISVAKKQLEDQLFKSLQKSFRGNKNITIKRGR